MKMTIAMAGALGLLGCGAAGATGPAAVETSEPGTSIPEPSVRAPSGDQARDRAAIRKMAGEFEVRFYFQETVPLTAGYSMWAPYASEATELVEIIDESDGFISLQHVLVLGSRVVKHWRQDWTYEDDSYYEFRGHRRWEERTLSEAERRGSWVQRVYQVDDSPRYASHGWWKHAVGGVSSWQSQPTWRPLPRREYTKRDDYHVLVAVNRHTLTDDGWVHEQDNTKLVLDQDGRQVRRLTREVGLNQYRRTTEVDFSPGRDYWRATSVFWADVRAAWAAKYARGEPITLRDELDGKTLWQHMFAMASEVKETSGYDGAAMRSRIESTLHRFAAPEDHR